MLNWVSPCISLLFLSASTVVGGYIFTAPTCTATIMSLQPCALNAHFQHFIPRFNKISLLYGYPWKKGLGERRPKDRVTLQIILLFTPTRLRNIYTGHVSVFDKYLHWPRLSVKIIYTLQQDKCKCKKIGCVSVNDLHLHWICTPYIWLLTLTRTTLVDNY